MLRGARQVGKTWLVRALAERSGRDLVEVNFERDPQLRDAFSSNDPKSIIGQLSLRHPRPITERSLLFLDEIQEFSEGIAKLRWFAEEWPELPVVAAGSLLEFALRDHHFSMPVGRVAFHRVEPLGFLEYARAHGQENLVKSLAGWRPGLDMEKMVANTAAIWMERFAMVGGMPGVVARELEGAAPSEIREAQRQLVATYRADFPKYAGRMDANVLDKVLRAVARDLGRKFVYARADDSVRQHQAKAALELLNLARVCRLIVYSAGNGIPLAAQSKDTFRKAALLDVGILHALAETPARQAFPELKSLQQDLRAAVVEQITVQELSLLGPTSGDPPQLFYWQREGGRPGRRKPSPSPPIPGKPASRKAQTAIAYTPGPSRHRPRTGAALARSVRSRAGRSQCFGR
jgi:predicted AAA+ superfamily ATPase